MTIPQIDLEAAIRKTVLLYNRLKSPEAVAKVLHVSPELVTISFSGSFCYECSGVQKYAEDFAKDFKIFIDFMELVAWRTRETNPRVFEEDFTVKAR
jgi:hypothetical protein